MLKTKKLQKKHEHAFVLLIMETLKLLKNIENFKQFKIL